MKNNCRSVYNSLFEKISNIATICLKNKVNLSKTNTIFLCTIIAVFTIEGTVTELPTRLSELFQTARYRPATKY